MSKKHLNLRVTLHRTSILLLTIILAATLQQSAALALTSGDFNSILNNTAFYDPSDTAKTCGSTDNDQLIGSENQEKAFNYLKSKGLSDEQAAGTVGNLIAESGLDPKADNSGSYKGIAQWDTGGRWARFIQWANSANLDTFSFDTQMKYVWVEATERGNIDGIKKYTDVPHTTWYWGRYFEVAIINRSTSETPLTNVQDLAGRTVAAQQVFNKYGGNGGPRVNGLPSDTSTGCNTGGIPKAVCTSVNAAPPNNFKIVNFPGTSKKTDERTLYMVNLANDCLKQLGEPKITVLQGSYCAGGCAAASGSSHNKGATIDIRTSDRGGIRKVYTLLKVLREVGFAAWYRDGGDNPSFAGNEHIHAVALGAPETGANAPGSPAQLLLYCSGGDGLRGGQKDRQLSVVGRPLPDWALKTKPNCTRSP